MGGASECAGWCVDRVLAGNKIAALQDRVLDVCWGKYDFDNVCPFVAVPLFHKRYESVVIPKFVMLNVVCRPKDQFNPQTYTGK